jgi:hypothetical protein
VETLEMLITENDHYVSNFRIPSLISDDEKDIMQYIISSWESSGFTPDLLLLETAFPKAKGSFAGITELPATSLRVYMFNIIDDRVNRYIHDRMAKLNETVRDKGITSEITDEFDKLQRMSNRNKAKEISLNIDSKAVYDEMKLRPLGMRTGIKAIDEKIGGMNKGTVTTIAGFTSQYKTTFALNIARIGSYYDGYNIAYLSLETPKNDMNWNLLSCHSYEPTLSTFSFVCHDRMRKCELTQAEEDFVFNVVEKDLKGDVVIDSEGNTEKRGRIVFLDESDFDSFSFGEISAVLERVDEELEKDMGRGLDAIIVDYIQLCKFSGSGMTHDANAQINSYVTFFRRLGQNFRKSIDANGNESTKQLIVILLAQINRDNWRRAKNNEGRYDITCLADANELERGSYRVFTTYTSEELKGRKSAQVQILKNRTGQTMYEPSVVYADGEAYVFQDEDGITKTFGGDQTASLETLFDSMDDNSLASFGL